MKLWGWINEKPSGQDMIRIRLPFTELAKHGWETSWGRVPYFAFRDNDVVVGCIIAQPQAAGDWTRRCGVLDGPFMVFETDDDYLGLAPYNSARREWENADQRFGYIASMRTSHRIVTSTDYLAQLLYEQTGHPDIVVARNTVPASMLEIPKPQNEHLVIGWAGGSSHEGDWAWAKDGVRRALTKLPEWKLRFIGMDYRPTMRLPADRLEYVPWTTDVEEFWHSDALGLDIGLAPIMPSAFNRSKSEIKLIEYAARGIPVVAADYGIYRSFVKHGETGFLVKDKKGWTAAIMELAHDEDLRTEMGAQARLQATDHTIEARWPEYKEAYTP